MERDRQGKRKVSEIMELYKKENGEIVLILVVLIGLVLIFKDQLTSLINSIFKQITSQSKKVY
ncbi:hypothetical protein FACS189418_5790 [Clostridia bacterium]|nr:hypothetical protein FACS189418_5790 [Clostridia bacterium]